MVNIQIRESKEFHIDDVLNLYRKNNWSAAEKPDLLEKALKNSDTLLLAYNGEQLIGLGNAITDGYLVVYYPHLLVLPEFHGIGVGKLLMNKFQKKYGHFHQQLLTADGNAIRFYEKCGFNRADGTESMWIYHGNDH